MISIITATFNSAKEIEDTYQSICNQTFTDWEWLVTDDFSSDSTVEILKKIEEKDSRVKVYSSHFNSGAAVARNNSISRAQGKYIAFLDSDDIWVPDKLYFQYNYMEDTDCNFSFTAYELINETGESLGKSVDTLQTMPLTYGDMLRKKATLGCSTVMLRREGVPDLEMPLIRTGQDYALWLKILKSGEKAFPINQVLTKYRILPNSISRNKFKKAKRQWQIYRQLERLSLFDTVISFCFYAYRAVFRA
ncbi:glycosyltransferase family 2 protein [Vibrio breoganii]|uniref:glycosyltransferase family 2 protein n=1 Tax=Vibrio breoganii TaxID=553239 RepID=UPI001F52EEA7|nr:glycosyltransferase family 2 protein [Vibrio breoganii]